MLYLTTACYKYELNGGKGTSLYFTANVWNIFFTILSPVLSTTFLKHCCSTSQKTVPLLSLYFFFIYCLNTLMYFVTSGNLGFFCISS